MSATLSTNIRLAISERPGIASRPLDGLCRRIARHFARRAALASLREAEDRALRDIGLRRSQIEPAVYGSFTLSD